eukprot:4236266-Pleurochrysis_carterae.AAC.2
MQRRAQCVCMRECAFQLTDRRVERQRAEEAQEANKAGKAGGEKVEGGRAESERAVAAARAQRPGVSTASSAATGCSSRRLQSARRGRCASRQAAPPPSPSPSPWVPLAQRRRERRVRLAMPPPRHAKGAPTGSAASSC